MYLIIHCRLYQIYADNLLLFAGVLASDKLPTLWLLWSLAGIGVMMYFPGGAPINRRPFSSLQNNTFPTPLPRLSYWACLLWRLIWLGVFAPPRKSRNWPMLCRRWCSSISMLLRGTDTRYLLLNSETANANWPLQKNTHLTLAGYNPTWGLWTHLRRHEPRLYAKQQASHHSDLPTRPQHGAKAARLQGTARESIAILRGTWWGSYYQLRREYKGRLELWDGTGPIFDRGSVVVYTLNCGCGDILLKSAINYYIYMNGEITIKV